jgi:hypothetical protein
LNDLHPFYKDGKPGKIKPLTTLVHERMMEQPFVKFRRFDTEEFIDYGRARFTLTTA